MAATCTAQQPLGPGPRGPDQPHGAQQGPGGPQGPNGAPGAPRAEEQHHKPFFYVQPSQPFLPLQGLPWSVPMPYGQYYGYPGYGMPVVPGFQSYPYMEPPSFVVPHTHLHLMDYRRMLNPQYYQTLAYQSRRFRYQHGGQTRETANSEVQTEPLTFGPGSAQPEASSSPGPPGAQPISPAAAAKDDQPAEPPARAPPNGSFVIQTEEVRIECCATPVGLQLLRSHEAAGVSRAFAQDLPPCVDDDDDGVPEDRAEPGLRACPDILMVGTPGNGESIPPQEEEEPATSETSRGSVALPFDPEHLDDLRKREAAAWSAEDALTPPPQPFPKNHGETAEELPVGDVPKAGEDPAGVPEAEGRVPAGPMEAEPYPVLEVDPPPREEENRDGNDPGVPDLQDSFESLPAYLPSASWLADFESARYRSRLHPPPRPLTPACSNPPPRRRKLEPEGEDRATIRTPKERYDPGAKLGRRSLSDHECCLVRNHVCEGPPAPYASRRERLCARCLAKRTPCASPKRKAVPFRQRNDAPLPTCDACAWRGPALDGGGCRRGRDTDGESSENGVGVGRPGDPRRPLASKRNLARPRGEEERGPPPPACRPLRCPHGNAIKEMDENCAVPRPLQEKWRHVDPFYQRENPWRALTPKPGGDARSPHLNKHKRAHARAQGSHRKDTRC